MSHTKHHHALAFFSRFRISLIVCGLLLALLLTACNQGDASIGTSTDTTGSNTPAATHGITITPRATSPITITPRPHPTSPANLSSYTGNGFQISYPTGWVVDKASTSAASVIFVDPTRTREFIVTVTPNPNAGLRRPLRSILF